MNRLLRVVVPALVAIGVAVVVGACGTEHVAVPHSDPTMKFDQPAAVLFNQRCAGCHTLNIAGASGSGQNPRTYDPISGVNFNQRCERPAIRVLYAIANGGFSGAYMPQNIVVGEQARELAAFVSKYAGHDAPKEPGVTPCSEKPIGALPTAAPASAP